MQLLTGKNQWVLHITYWIMVVLLFTFFWGTRYGNYWVCFYNELYFLPIKIAATYFGLYYLIPQLFKRNYYRVVIVGSVVIIVSGLLQRIIGYYSFIPEVGFYLPDIALFDITEILHKIMDINAVMIIPLSIKFYTHYLDKEHKILLLSQEKTEAELQFLRSQIQPHFLFNVLNDIYAMALLKKKETPDSILKLADLMRYVLQESTESKVPLEKEINYIRNYIDLEKLRYSELYTIHFEVKGNTANTTITPLLLLPFIENAYKHSTTNQQGGAWINIDINLHNEVLTMEITNSYDPTIPKVTQISSGIGIQNVIKRLQILYPGNYTFESNSTASSYKTKLIINLNT